MPRVWHETDHPRDPHTGEFVDRPGGGWAGIAVGRWFGGPSDPDPSSGYVRGRDLRGDLDYDALSELAGTSRTGGDDALDALYALQGYHGKPELYSSDELEDLIDDGWTELHRGVTGDDGPEMVGYAQQFREGEKHFPGLGIFGNGTYTTTNANEVHEYTVADSRYPERDDPPAHLRYPGIIRMALRPDAKVIDIEGLPIDYDSEYNEAPKDVVLADAGRLAAAMGYDAIRRDFGGVVIVAGTHYIILNRTAVAVQRWDPPGVTPPTPERKVTRRELLDELDLGYEFEVLIPEANRWMHVDRWVRDDADGGLMLLSAGDQYLALVIEHDYHFIVRPWNG